MTSSFVNTCKGLIRSLVGTSSPTNNMENDVSKKAGLFANCSFAIIRTAAFSPKDAESVRDAPRESTG
jgi:hypothetical protein